MIRFAASDFRSPSRSDDVRSTCVDLACRDGVVELRDSKVEFGSPGDHRIRLSYAEFDAVQRAVRAGRADCADQVSLSVTRRADGRYEFRADGQAGVLVFDQAELDAFHHDIHVGEYDARLLATAIG